jgi:hypothetical protein
MKEFALLFRQPDIDYTKMDASARKEVSKKWLEWVGSIAMEGKLVGNPVRLNLEGKVLRTAGVITDGPFVEIKEKLGSFLVVKAKDIDEATTLAHGCPALDAGGSVEIRPMFTSELWQ